VEVTELRHGGSYIKNFVLQTTTHDTSMLTTRPLGATRDDCCCNCVCAFPSACSIWNHVELMSWLADDLLCRTPSLPAACDLGVFFVLSLTVFCDASRGCVRLKYTGVKYIEKVSTMKCCRDRVLIAMEAVHLHSYCYKQQSGQLWVVWTALTKQLQNSFHLGPPKHKTKGLTNTAWCSVS
jgi:hypothetical protein